MSLALGIDVGTSGVRTAVMDGQTVLSTARVDHGTSAPDRGDANGWWAAVQSCLASQREGLEAVGRKMTEVSSLCVDGTSGSMVLTDKDLRPVSSALMYNSKGFVAEADRIAAVAPEVHITRGSNSALARALRLVSEATARPAHLLHQADFIAARLMGVGGHSDFNNALKTGFDPETEGWPPWMDQLLDPALLPRVHAPGAVIAPVAGTVAEAFGLSPDAMVHAGTTDSVAAFLAAAPLQEGVAVTSLGSTLAVKCLSPRRIDDPSIGLYSHRIGDFWLVGGASNTGGAVLRSFFSDEALARLSAAMDIERPTGLDYYPLLQPGERFPINDPDLPPRLKPRPDDDGVFLQGLLEAMARIEADCYAQIATRGGGPLTAVYTAGGGARNAAWTALRAKALGLEPSPAAHGEAAVGVATLPTSVR